LPATLVFTETEIKLTDHLIPDEAKPAAKIVGNYLIKLARRQKTGQARFSRFLLRPLSWPPSLAETRFVRPSAPVSYFEENGSQYEKRAQILNS
jgi:hypothetical protein